MAHLVTAIGHHVARSTLAGAEYLCERNPRIKRGTRKQEARAPTGGVRAPLPHRFSNTLRFLIAAGFTSHAPHTAPRLERPCLRAVKRAGARSDPVSRPESRRPSQPLSARDSSHQFVSIAGSCRRRADGRQAPGHSRLEPIGKRASTPSTPYLTAPIPLARLCIPEVCAPAVSPPPGAPKHRPLGDVRGCGRADGRGRW
ncbi:hypothetical protein C8Q77DRAFT_366539 [Trametes polyzona]|nr:hypothetical protein C8Q77DRAFT_366539 [Trametes polyzona]